MPAIVQFFVDATGYHHEVDVWYLDGNYLLGLMVLCVHLPLGKLARFFHNNLLNFLGLFRRIDFLGFTSFIGMACMSTFVIMVIKKQSQATIEIFRKIERNLKKVPKFSNPKIRLMPSVVPLNTIILTKRRLARLRPLDSTEVR